MWIFNDDIIYFFIVQNILAAATDALSRSNVYSLLCWCGFFTCENEPTQQEITALFLFLLVDGDDPESDLHTSRETESFNQCNHHSFPVTANSVR